MAATCRTRLERVEWGRAYGDSRATSTVKRKESRLQADLAASLTNKSRIHQQVRIVKPLAWPLEPDHCGGTYFPRCIASIASSKLGPRVADRKSTRRNSSHL